jgi:antitoxin component YwqK of YwqJK toxin-antitoxin module
MNTVDNEFLQSILNETTLSPAQKIAQIKGFVTGDCPNHWVEEDNVFQTGASNDGHWWCSQTYYPNGLLRFCYSFIPQPLGERKLVGLYQEYFESDSGSQPVPKYFAQYEDGVISDCIYFYPSGNIKTECFFTDGVLNSEYDYPDNEDYYDNDCFTTSSTICAESDTGVKMVLAYPNFPENCDTVVLQETYFQHGLENGNFTEKFLSGMIKCTGWYQNGLRDGHWYGYFESGEPKYYQLWNDGELEYETVWDVNGNLSQKLKDDLDLNFKFDMKVKRLTKNLTPEYANSQLNQTSMEDGMKRMWDDILDKAVRYGHRCVCIDVVTSEYERISKLEIARKHFEGFCVYSLPTMSPTYLEHICLYVPKTTL